MEKKEIIFVGSKAQLGSPIGDLSCIRWIKESHIIDGIIYAIDFLVDTRQVAITYALLNTSRSFLSTDVYVEVKQIKLLQLSYEMFNIFITSEKGLSNHLTFSRNGSTVIKFKVP